MGKPCRNCGGVTGACLAPDQAVGAGGANIAEWKADATGKSCLFVGAEKAQGVSLAPAEEWNPNFGFYGDPNLATLRNGELFVERPCLENLTLRREAEQLNIAAGGLSLFGETQLNATGNDSVRSINPAILMAVADSAGSIHATIERTGIYSVETWATLMHPAVGSSSFVQSFQVGPSIQVVGGLPRGTFPEYGNSFPNSSTMSGFDAPVSTSAWTGLMQRGEIIRGLNYKIELSNIGVVFFGERQLSVTFLGPEC